MAPPTHVPAIGTAGSKWDRSLALPYIGFHTDIFRFLVRTKADLRARRRRDALAGLPLLGLAFGGSFGCRRTFVARPWNG